ncbi:MAG: hypothetical protein SGPRY_004031, partial [Prymnesium sp.]
MAAQVIEVAIPDGVGPGEAFLVEFNGTQFNITAPDGCGPGTLIQVEVPGNGEEPPAEANPDALADPAPQLIEVAIPDGVGPGEAFLVEFNGTQFNITVPDGCGPGVLIQVEVPDSAPDPGAGAPVEPAAADPPAERELSNLKINDSASTSNNSMPNQGGQSTKSDASSSKGAGSSSYSSVDPSSNSTSSSKKSTNYSSNYSGNYSSNYKYDSSKYNQFDYEVRWPELCRHRTFPRPTQMSEGIQRFAAH